MPSRLDDVAVKGVELIDKGLQPRAHCLCVHQAGVNHSLQDADLNKQGGHRREAARAAVCWAKLVAAISGS